MNTRELEVCVISDLHLATHACKSKKILKYLRSIHPKILVLNGDIIDSWRFSRNYFPKSHLKVVRQLIKMMEKGARIFYITGNHDEFLRRFEKIQIGNLQILNQLVLELNGKKTWIFHGDIFDEVIHETKWLAKTGAAAYGLITLINNGLAPIFRFFTKKEIILFKSIKNSLTKEKPEPSVFERKLSEVAVKQGYSTVICGHTHVPKEKLIEAENTTIHYLNCGDWVENFTAAEYESGKWSLNYYVENEEETTTDDTEIPDDKKLYQSLLKELVYANML